MLMNRKMQRTSEKRIRLVRDLKVFKNLLTEKDKKFIPAEILKTLPESSKPFPYTKIVKKVVDGSQNIRKYVSYLHKVMRGEIAPEYMRNPENLNFLKKVYKQIEKDYGEYAQYLGNFIRKAETWMKGE